MPVPETRRFGGQESYTTSTYSRTGRSYLSPSTYTSSSKYTSSVLPPRPHYERKLTDSSTMPISRFLPSTRTSGQYGTSSLARASVSPIRAASSSYRTPSVTDRVKSLEPDLTPRYSRLRETSSSVNSKLPSTYTGYTRDRSGSRELGTSPLSGSSMSLAAREMKTRSASIGPSANSAPTTRAQRNGLPRLSSIEVTQTNESSSTPTSATTTTTTTSNTTTTTTSERDKGGATCGGSALTPSASGAQALKLNNDKCKDVENNDSFNSDASPLLASGTPPLTTTTTTVITTSASATSPSPPPSQAKVYMNGNMGNGEHHTSVTIHRPSARSRVEVNQDKNGNSITNTSENGFDHSDIATNSNSKISRGGETLGSAHKLGTKAAAKQTTPPRVIYHKIHIVQNEDEPSKSPSPEKQGAENGESTNSPPTTTTTKNKISALEKKSRLGNATDVKIVEITPISTIRNSNGNILDEAAGRMSKNLGGGKRESSPIGVTAKLFKTKIEEETEGDRLGRSPSKSPSPAEKESSPSPNSNHTDSNRNEEYKIPVPPPLPIANPIITTNGEENHNVGEMAGPHASKYREEEEMPGTSTGHSTLRRGGEEKPRYESDSSENDSDAYTSSPQLGGRFRSREKDQAQCGLTGLRNIGNTCFMNSVLQCLSNTKPLLDYLLTDNYTSDINTTTSSMKGALIRAFANVIQELWRESRTVDTSAFKDQIQRFAPRFMGYSQQDAQEFLRYLLEGLHEEINRVVTKPKPILTDIDESLSDTQKSMESWKRYLRSDDSKIVDIFVGQFKSTLKCTTCGHCSVTFDPFWDLSLPIPSKTSSTRLSQCLELFAREETLDGDEKPTCAKCQTRRKCTKSLSIQRFPKVLVIHLKRFSPSERFRGKLNTTVEFPLNGLDMTPYAANRAQGCTYNLYGISNHSGSTYSGHYIAYCKHPKTGEWNTYNDSRVSPISSQSVASSEGYVLFYELANQSSHL